MISLKQVHERIKNISNVYASGMPPLHIDSIAEELNADKQEVRKHVRTLATLTLITYHEDSPDVFKLTALGKTTVL